MASLRVKRWLNSLREVAKLEDKMHQLAEQQLRKESLALRYRAMSGEPLAGLLPEAFALVREAGRRSLGMRHFDVQIAGGAALFDGCIAEMQTGEGKTLTATLPLYLHSLLGKGAHLATVMTVKITDARRMLLILPTGRQKNSDLTFCEIDCCYALRAEF
jgi:preprotein translocase subunit SecA